MMDWDSRVGEWSIGVAVSIMADREVMVFPGAAVYRQEVFVGNWSVLTPWGMRIDGDGVRDAASA